MIVLRVETQDRKGPYNRLCCELGIGWETDGRHPSPSSDFPREALKESLWSDYNWHFGFASEDQLREWFRDDELRQLEQRGARVYLFEVPAEYVVRGSRQIMFRKDKATRLEGSQVREAEPRQLELVFA